MYVIGCKNTKKENKDWKTENRLKHILLSFACACTMFFILPISTKMLFLQCENEDIC
jgi:hypothetical protein